MVQLTRPTPDQATVVPRDSTAAVWHDLNHIGLRVGAFAGFGAAVAYLLLFVFTRSMAFAVSAGLGLVIGLSGLVGIRRRSSDMEIVLVTAALAAITSATIASPIGRGGLWAAISVIATVGALLLPDTKRTRFLVFVAALVLGQLLWPVLGYSTLVEAIANVVVSGTCTTAGAAIVTIAKRALDRSERSRIEMFRSVPVGLFRCSPSGIVVDANPALSHTLGHENPDGLIGRQIADLHEDPEDWTRLAAELDGTFAPQRFAHRLHTASGDVLWVRGVAQAIRSDGGEVIYHEGSIEDVTQRREVEETARLNADRFRNVFERAPIALWEEDYSRVGIRLDELRAQGVTDVEQYLEARPTETRRLIEMIEFIDVNPAGIQLIGAESKEVALRGIDVATMPEDVRRGFIEEFVAIWEGRDAMTIEIKGSTMDGRDTDLALSWAVGRTPDGDLDLSRVIIAIQNIDIIRQAERDLAALVASKDDLVASVSHELRTPITTILGMAFELRDHGEHFSVEEVQDLVSIIADQSRELSNIVEDLLVAAWSDSDTLSVRPEVVNIRTELERIVSTDPDGPTIDIHRPVLAWIDPLRFRQILRNLLTNARKYGGETVTITAAPQLDRVVVSVIDNGDGVPEDDRSRIFDAYFRSRSDQTLPGSLGLGLPVSRRLARLMGGDLTYRYDGTSIFELTIPAPIRGHFL